MQSLMNADRLPRIFRIGARQPTLLDRAEEPFAGLRARYRSGAEADRVFTVARMTQSSVALVTGPMPKSGRFRSRSLGKRVLPTSATRWRTRRIGRFEIVQHHVAVLVIERRHVVAADHQVDRILPLRARHALLRHQLETVAGGARIERFIATQTRGEILRAFVARREGCLGDGRRNPKQSGHCEPRQTQHYPTSTAMRCMALPP